MKISLLIKKLYLSNTSFVDSKTIKEYCGKINLDYNTAIRYLTSRKYLVRILKGTFYRLSLEERKFKKVSIGLLEAIAEAMRMKGITNWYFGLETAIKLNSLTHEHYAVDYVISDKLFRAKPITILGHKVRFIKLKKSLFGFGIKKYNSLNFSDNEKTLLDMVYLARYDGLTNDEIKSSTSDLTSNCSKEKLLRYSEEYNGAVKSFVGKLKWTKA